MTLKPIHHNIILGISDTETVKLDLDKVNLKISKYWAKRAYFWFKLRGYIILRSSKAHYHIIFDRKVNWKTNIRVMAWVAIQIKSIHVKNYVLMQCIKKASTLRVSGKKNKPAPKIVYRFGSQDKMIQSYLNKREEIFKYVEGEN